MTSSAATTTNAWVWAVDRRAGRQAKDYLRECGERKLRVESERDALQARLAADEAAGRESCREWSDVMADRCGRPADFILWGKLFPPEALGPRCRDCAEKHTRTDRWTVEQSAIFDLRPFAGGTDE